MNCDDFLPALETGGPLQRRRARRHAAGCPRCAAVAEQFAAVKRQWAETRLPPLSNRERQVWEQAAEIEVDRPLAMPLTLLRSRRRFPWAVAAGLAAAACVLIFIALNARHKPGPTFTKTPPPHTQPAPKQVATTAGPSVHVTPVDDVAALARLSGAVEVLESEMRQLRTEAERADARQQVALVLSRFDPPH